jgi:hypothetical protein
LAACGLGDAAVVVISQSSGHRAVSKGSGYIVPANSLSIAGCVENGKNLQLSSSPQQFKLFSGVKKAKFSEEDRAVDKTCIKRQRNRWLLSLCTKDSGEKMEFRGVGDMQDQRTRQCDQICVGPLFAYNTEDHK